MKTFTESEKIELNCLANNYTVERMLEDNILDFCELVPVDNIVKEVLRRTKPEIGKAKALSSIKTLLDIEVYKLKQDMSSLLHSQDLAEQGFILDFTKLNNIEQGVMNV